MSCVVGMFLVCANRRKTMMAGGDTVVRGNWWACLVGRSYALYVRYGRDLLGVGLGA